MLTTKHTPDQVDIPHEIGEWMKFRMVSWAELNKARGRKTSESFAMLAQVPAEVLASLPKADDKSAIPTADEYDQRTLLEAAIAEWSYEADVLAETIGQLDQETADWAFQVILARNVRSKSEGEASGPASKPITETPGAGPKN